MCVGVVVVSSKGSSSTTTHASSVPLLVSHHHPIRPLLFAGCLSPPLPERGRHPLSRCGGVQTISLSWELVLMYYALCRRMRRETEQRTPLFVLVLFTRRWLHHTHHKGGFFVSPSVRRTAVSWPVNGRHSHKWSSINRPDRTRPPPPPPPPPRGA